MANSWSNLVDNLAEVICKIKSRDCDSFSEHESFKDKLIKYKHLSCNKIYSSKIDDKLKKRLKNAFKFSHNDTNKFILLLRKVAYPYDKMDNWEKFNEITLPEKEDFYSNLTMEGITDAYYINAKGLCKDFEIKNLGEFAP